MGTRIHSSRALIAAAIALLGAASVSVVHAQETVTPSSNNRAQTVTAGQGGYFRLPDTTPAPSTYALTGEESPYRQSLRAWQRQAGPVFSVGNGTITLPATR